MQGKLTVQDIPHLAEASQAAASRTLHLNPSVDPLLNLCVIDVAQGHSFFLNMIATTPARSLPRLVSTHISLLPNLALLIRVTLRRIAGGTTQTSKWTY